jgi:uncharacterized membrane protein (UPF0127 family)
VIKSKVNIYKVLVLVILIVFTAIVTFVPGLFYGETGTAPIVARYEKLTELVYLPDRSFATLEIVNTTGTTTLGVEVVNTLESRQLGLSGRKGLAGGEGMLFAFQEPSLYNFWMKDMLFPLDIIWINTEGSIVHIETNKGPETYPNAFAPTEPAQFVLETSAGFVDFFGVKVGDEVKFKKI